MSFPLDLFGRCAERRSAGGGMATSAGDTSVKLEGHRVNPSKHG